MEKSIRRLLSVMLALVLTVGIFPGTTAARAAEVSANGIDDQNDAGNGTVSNVDAFWNAMAAYDVAVANFWEKPDAFQDAYGSLLESEEALTEEQWNPIYADWKALSQSWESQKQTVETTYASMTSAYNALTETEKEDKDLDDSESVSPTESKEEADQSYTDVENWEFFSLPTSPYLQTYLDRLDKEDNGIYALIDIAGDAKSAFDSANEAYQTELDKENPDPAALNSLYGTAMEKYTELSAASNALEKEYKELETLYKKVPAEEKNLVYEDGNGVSIEWNSLNETMSTLRNDIKQAEKPVSLGKNVKEDIQPGAPSTKLVYTDKDALLNCIGLKDDEKSKASIEVVLTVAPKNMTQAESGMVTSALPGGYVTGCALDLSMYLNLNGTKERDITKTASPVGITVTIPQNLINTDASVTRTYKIVRIHDNAAQVLDGTYNAQDHTFTFSTDCFSTYVIIYKDDKAATSNPGDTGQSGNTEQPGNTSTGQNGNSSQISPVNLARPAGVAHGKAVKTGDETPLTGLLAGMVCSLILGVGSVLLYIWRRKKRLL